MSGNVRLAIVLGLTALGTIFIAQNTTVVEIRFLFWTLAMSRALMIIFVLLVGVVLGWLLQAHLAHAGKKKHDEPASGTRSR